MGVLVLSLGLTAWIIIHFMPSLWPEVRARLVERLGLRRYKGLFALLIVGSVVLIVAGWRGTVPQAVYARPEWGRDAAFGLMFPALFLFFAARLPTNVKRVMRHPQLTGVLLWSVAHLLASGDVRSVILFSFFGAWAIAEMFLINLRDGPRALPGPVPRVRDGVLAVVALAAYGLLLYLHRFISGVSLLA
jgi:uncharacterized membrane protein